MHDFEAGHFESVQFRRDRREFAGADAEYGGFAVVGEFFGIAAGIAGHGYGASGRAGQVLAAGLAFGHEALAVGMQPEEVCAGSAHPLKERCIPGNGQAQLAGLQFFCEAGGEGRLGQDAVDVCQKIFRRDRVLVGRAKQFEQVGEDVGLGRVGCAIQGDCRLCAGSLQTNGI